MNAIDDGIPAVCFIDDLARIFRISRRTLEGLRRNRVLPIPELPALDRRPRWAGEAVRRFLSADGAASRFRRVR